MAFLDEAELSSLQIQQSVFHIVGPGSQHFQLLSAFDATPYADFFLQRIRSVNGGNRYRFLDDAPVRLQLARIAADPGTFQEESERLATAFDAAHRGSAAVGAFLVFTLTCCSGQIFALLKFEDEKVLSYDFRDTGAGHPMPTFDEIKRNFVENRNALQKAALIRVINGADEVCVVDRQNPQKPAAYFEQFLLVRRSRSEAELTQAIVDATRKVALKHKAILPPETMKNLSQRLFDASQSGGAVDGERCEDWFRNIVGPLADDSPVLEDFRAELKRQGMAGESFVLKKNAIPAPRNRRVETASGIKVTYPATLAASFIKVDKDHGLITINDEITLYDYELDRPLRPRP